MIADDPLVERFEREYAGRATAVPIDVVESAVRAARLVLVGDHRPSPGPKAWLARLLAWVPAGVPLHCDVFQQSDAGLVSLWLEGRLSARELCAQARFDLELGVPFTPYARLLRAEWRRGRRLSFIESAVRSDRGGRRQRFALAARRLARELGSGRTVVFAGQAYLGRGFFPRLLRRAVGARARSMVTIVFLPHCREPLLYGGGRFALPHGPAVPPRKARASGGLDLGATVYRLVDELCRALGIDPYRRRVSCGGKRIYLRDAYPPVVARAQGLTAGRILAGGGLDAAEVRDCRARLSRRGSLYVARANTILIGRARLVDGAEEAAHFVNLALRGDAGASFESSFYEDVWDEAVAYLGSKILDPRRRTPSLRALARARSRGVLEQVRRFVVAHGALERRYASMARIPPVVAQGVARGGRFHDVAHHALGYRLGERLFRRYRSGALSRTGLRRLFEAKRPGARAAFSRYLEAWAGP